MKLIYSIILFLLFAVFSYAQSPGDSLQVQEKTKIESEQEKHSENTLESKGKKRDVFIDKDGDGICDQRVNGMSFERMKKMNMPRHKRRDMGGRR